MALGAGVFILGGLALAAFGGGKKKRKKVTNGKKQLPSEPPTPPQEIPIVRWEVEDWYMPEGWLEEYATPRLREYVSAQFEQDPNEPEHAPEIDALDATLYIIEGQTNGFPLPASAQPPEGDMWQANVPNAVDYYPGPASVLGLFYHVAEYVEDALGRWQAGDELYLADLEPYEEGD